uniref:Uncharacterized protein n=1 Tax=Micrurus spixii TaxID=129469 RepID=A0A2D4LFW3_9SAUR
MLMIVTLLPPLSDRLQGRIWVKYNPRDEGKGSAHCRTKLFVYLKKKSHGYKEMLLLIVFISFFVRSLCLCSNLDFPSSIVEKTNFAFCLCISDTIHICI